MKISNLSEITSLNHGKMNKDELKSLEAFNQKSDIARDFQTMSSGRNSALGIKDIREMLINLNFQLTDLNLDIAKKLLKYRMPITRESFEKVLAALKQLGDSSCLSKLEDQSVRAMIKDLGLSLAIFLLERNVPLEPKSLNLMLRLILRESGNEDILDYKAMLDSSAVFKNSFAYNYYPMNLELKDQTSLFLELFILPEGQQSDHIEGKNRLVFCVDSHRLGLIKFDLGLDSQALDLRILLEREDFVDFVNQHISLLKEQLSSRGHKIAGITCGVDTQSSFSYVENLLELPQYKLDARV